MSVLLKVRHVSISRNKQKSILYCISEGLPALILNLLPKCKFDDDDGKDEQGKAQNMIIIITSNFQELSISATYSPDSTLSINNSVRHIHYHI